MGRRSMAKGALHDEPSTTTRFPVNQTDVVVSSLQGEATQKAHNVNASKGKRPVEACIQKGPPSDRNVVIAAHGPQSDAHTNMSVGSSGECSDSCDAKPAQHSPSELDQRKRSALT